MPELPEVETIARGVHDRIAGDRIERAWLGEKKEPFKTPAPAMAEALAGKRIHAVRRVGKHIVFDLEGRRGETGRQGGPREVQWIVHLGMTGRLLVSPPEVEVPPHTHAILTLRSGRELRFVDARRFGRLAIHALEPAGKAGKAGDNAERGFRGPGREPLTISLDDFVQLFHRRKLPIKAALLNQKLLHGVGNIYADEALFRAGIRPRRIAGRLKRDELARLHQGLKEVLREAIRLGGSSVSDYVDADGAEGFFQLEHRVYMRTGQPCLVCGTPIRRILLAGRGTHYCPHCQH